MDSYTLIESDIDTLASNPRISIPGITSQLWSIPFQSCETKLLDSQKYTDVPTYQWQVSGSWHRGFPWRRDSGSHSAVLPRVQSSSLWGMSFHTPEREERERPQISYCWSNSMELQTTIKASSAHFEWSVPLASFIQSYKDGHYSSLLTTWKCVPLVDLLNSLLWAVVCHLHFATWDAATTCTSDFFPHGMWLCSIDKATKGLGMRLAACKNKPLSENDNSLWKWQAYTLQSHPG